MNKILIDIREENDRITDYFKNKDLLSIEELLNAIDNLLGDIDYLEEKIRDMETSDEPDYYKIWRDNQN